MTQNGRVKQILEDGRAVVCVQRQSACTHDCASCSGGCGAAFTPELEVIADNDLCARQGDSVKLTSSTKTVLKAAAVVYIIPIAAFILGVIITTDLSLSGGASAAICVGLFLAGVAVGMIYNRKQKKNGEITYKIAEILK